MYKTIWNYISKHSKKSSTASVFLPVLVLEWTVLGLFAGALICLFLHNTTALVKATIVRCISLFYLSNVLLLFRQNSNFIFKHISQFYLLFFV